MVAPHSFVTRDPSTLPERGRIPPSNKHVSGNLENGQLVLVSRGKQSSFRGHVPLPSSVPVSSLFLTV